MELSIKDRLYLPIILPKEGNFADFNCKKNILKKISISEDEKARINLRQNDETHQILWDVNEESSLPIELSSDEIKYLKRCCELISDQNLEDDMWLLVEKLYNFNIEVG